MNKKAWKAGAVSALAVGAGLAAAASKRKKAGKVVKSASDYRNREIMRHLHVRRNRRESRANRLISSEVAWLLWRRRVFL